MRKLLALGVLACWFLAPNEAWAQYKNSAFGLDAGGWLIYKPSVVDGKNNFLPVDKRPLRLESGLRLGGETNFKMDTDHTWFTGRVNASFLQFPKGDSTGTPDQRFDAAAHETIGTVFGIQGQVGIRYLFLTDRFRPYLQGSLSFLRLMSFSSLAEEGCSDQLVCGSDSNNLTEFLPHPNIGGVHLQPGAEIIFTRDVALHLFLDVQRWILFNAPDNTSVVLGLGILFFT